MSLILPPPTGDGGGGLWTTPPVESRNMTGNALELFSVGEDDVIRFEFDDLIFSAEKSLLLSFSVDDGVTYPSTVTEQNFRWGDGFTVWIAGNPTGVGAVTFTDQAFLNSMNGYIEIKQIKDSGFTTFKYEFRGYTVLSTKWQTKKGSGAFETNGVVNKIKFSASGGLFDGGKIHHIKRAV